MSGGTRTTGKVGALTLATVVLVASIAALQSQAARAAAEPLAPGSDFTISSTVSSSVTAPDGAGLLYPGVTRYLWYTVTNPLTQPITVTALGIERVEFLLEPGGRGLACVDGAALAGCEHRCRRHVAMRLHAASLFLVLRPKNRGPDHGQPVITLATAVRLVNRCPRYSKSRMPRTNT